MKYTVTNVYDITGGTTHRTPEAAIRAAKKREGERWTVNDSDGNQWWTDADGNPVIVEYAA